MQFEHIQSLGPMEAPKGIAHGHNAAFGIVQIFSRVGADVAKALNGNGGTWERSSQTAQKLEREAADSAASGFVAAWDAVVFNRLPRHARR